LFRSAVVLAQLTDRVLCDPAGGQRPLAQAFGPVFSVASGGIGCVLTVLLIAWRTPALANHTHEVEPSIVAG